MTEDAVNQKAESDAALTDMLREDANASAVGIARYMRSAVNWKRRCIGLNVPMLRRILTFTSSRTTCC